MKVEGWARRIRVDIVKIRLRAVTIHDVAREVQTDAAIKELRLRADFVGFHRFRAEGSKSLRAVVRTAGSEPGRIRGVEIDVRRCIERQRDHRISPVVVEIEGEIRGLVLDPEEEALTLIPSVPYPKGEVQHIEGRRGVGKLSESGIAFRFRHAVALHEPRTPVPSLV